MWNETDPGTGKTVVIKETGSDVLKIVGYSGTKAIPTGVHVSSPSFPAGGCSWQLAYLPNGDCAEDADYVAFFFVLDDGPAATTVITDFTIALLDRAGRPVPPHAKSGSVCGFLGRGAHWGFRRFIRWDTLEDLLLQHHDDDDDDCFFVKCDVTVVASIRAVVVEKGVDVAAAVADDAGFTVPVPPPDCLRHLRDLLLSAEGADVRFSVARESFAAHRCILAARSPVFRAELHGAAKDGGVVEVDGMRADVFRMLLYFVYTDELPEPAEPPPTTVGHGGEEEEDLAVTTAKHLLAAADRYGMERLKSICEDKLCRSIDVATVVPTLVLAEEHHCDTLKEACFQFLESQEVREAIMATDGFDHLTATRPSLFLELARHLLS
ncbi:hypothetical protein ACP4OV_012592 [Aristida adscensionis]